MHLILFIYNIITFLSLYRVDPNVGAKTAFSSTINRAMYRSRQETLGNIPNTLEEYGTTLEATPRFSQTIGGDDFYRATLGRIKFLKPKNLLT
jgi:hypothetical protein